MLDFLERMRQKPRAARERFVFVTAAVVTGIIFVIWLTTMGTRFGASVAPDPDVRRSADPTLEEADQTVRSALEKTRAEYEAFRQELQNIAPTSSPIQATTSESAESVL